VSEANWRRCPSAADFGGPVPYAALRAFLGRRRSKALSSGLKLSHVSEGRLAVTDERGWPLAYVRSDGTYEVYSGQSPESAQQLLPLLGFVPRPRLEFTQLGLEMQVEFGGSLCYGARGHLVNYPPYHALAR